MKSRCIWGETCFAEYCAANDTENNQPWTVVKYDSRWTYCLDNEADAMELVRILDARERQRDEPHALARGI